MNQLQALLQKLKGIDVSVQLAAEGELKIRGARQNLTAELVAELKQNKAELVAMLQKNQLAEHWHAHQLRRNPQEKAPLSFAQQRLWFTCSMNEQASHYNVPYALLLQGELCPDTLRASLSQLVRRHEILRTTYHQEQGAPYQYIRQPEDVPLQVLDWRDRGCSAESEELRRYLLQEAHRPFALESDLMLRATLVQLETTHWVFLLTLHHIAADGWSIGIIAQELSRYYNQHTGAAIAQPDSLEVQYADYAVWQQEMAADGLLAHQLSYWRQQLADLPVVHNLPLDYARPAQQLSDSRMVRVKLEKSVLQQLYTIAAAQQTTLFTLLQTAFSAFLARWSNETDIVLGTATAGRSRAELEPMVGFFVNTLVLRNKVVPDSPFLQQLAAANQMVQQAFEHQHVPFDMLVSELNPVRSMSCSPLVQIFFSLRNNAVSELQFNAIEVQPLDTQFETLRFDLELIATEQDDGLLLLWNFATSLFEAASVERMSRSFNLFVAQIAATPGSLIADLPLLAEDDVAYLHLLGCGADRHRHISLHRMVADWAATQPAAIALDYGDCKLSYQQLNQQANRLARFLLTKGLAGENTVGICSARSVEMIVAMLAILKAGGAYVMLDPDYPAERIAYMLQDSGAKLVLADSQHAALLPSSGAEVLIMQELDTGQYDATDLADVAPERLACVVYTSGSTGKPKGVLLEHRGLVRLVDNSTLIDFNCSDVVAQGSNCAFDLAFLEIWGSLCNGAKLCFVSRDVLLNVTELAEFLKSRQVTVLMATTALFNQMATLSAEIFHSLRVVLFGGEQADVSAVNRVVKYGKPGRLLNAYGPAENSCVSTFFEVQAELSNSIPIGQVISGACHVLVDQHGRLVPVGVIGELWVGGAGLSRGYLNKPELTASQFVDDLYYQQAGKLYKTGDLMRYRNDGSLEFIGRRDQQVKIRGFRIELSEIETVLARLAGVEQVVVHVVGQAGNKRLIAYVVMEQAARTEKSAELLIAQAKQLLPDYMVPSHCVVLDKLPLSANGKIDKKALPDVVLTDDAAGEAPATPTEVMLAEVWRTLLEVPVVHRDTDFFQGGGHSLLATRLVLAITEQLQVQIAIRDVFEYSRLSALAARIDSMAAHLVDAGPCPLPAGTAMTPSYVQQRFWLADQLYQDAVASQYTVSVAIDASGELNLPALQQALDTIGRRHEILRTSYHGDGDNLKVQLHDKATIALQLLDCRQQDESALKQTMKALAGQRFVLHEPQMLKAYVLQVSAKRQLLLFCFHHVAADGWSVGVFCQELSHCYNKFLQQQTPELLPLPVQYSDVAGWQRNQQQAGRWEQQLTYWKAQLANLPDCHSLPLDKERPVQPGFAGETVSTLLPAPLCEQLRALAMSQGVTSFMLYQAAFAVLLGRFSFSDDIVMGTPIAGRRHHTTESLIGCFINMLVLRTELSGAPAFQAVLQQTKQMAMAAFDHQDLPFEMLVEQLAPARSLSVNPLFQILFSMHNNTPPQLALDGIDARFIDASSDVVKFDLALHISEQADGHYAVWQFNSDLFTLETVRRFAAHYLLLLQAVAAQPDVSISQLPLLSADDQQILLHQFCRGKSLASPAGPVHQLFERQVSLQPEKVAIEWQGESLTYQQLNRAANQLAWQINQQYPAGSLIGISLKRTPRLLVSLMAVLKAGCAYVPLDPAYPKGRIRQIAQSSQLSMVIGEAETLAGLPADIGCMEFNSVDQFNGNPASNPQWLSAPDALAYVLFTSGSTGTPKGVEITHQNLHSLLSWFCDEFSSEQLARTLISTSLNFDPSVMEIFGTLCHGHTGILVDNCLALLERKVDVDFISTVPSVLQILVDQDAIAAGTKVIGVGGERLQGQLVSRLAACRPDIRLYNFYGPTECTVNATFDWCQANDNGAPPIGRPLPNTALYVLSESQQILPVGAVGELYIGGQTVARGYHCADLQTAQRFLRLPQLADAGRVYRTGDLVRFLPDGRLSFLGRIDEQVKIRGFRIELAEIEQQLLQHPAISAAVVIVRQFEADQRLVAYLICDALLPAEATDAFTEQLTRYLADTLPGYMIPAYFVLLPEFPRLPNGKIDRKSLPEPVQNAGRQHIPATSPTEQKLALIWQELLQLDGDSIGIHDNFFRLGGHSLLIVTLANRISQQFGVQLQMAEIYKLPTIQQLAQRIDGKHSEHASAEPMIVPLQDGQGHPLFVIHPVGGDALCYAPLVAELALACPVVGLQRPDLAVAGTVQQYSLRELAALYVTAILRQQPVGPYRILGWSMGGLIATEIATLLEQQGSKVSYLGVIDAVDHNVHDDVIQSFQLDREYQGSLAEFLSAVTEPDRWVAEFDQRFNIKHLLQLHTALPAQYLREIVYSGVIASLRHQPVAQVSALYYYGALQTQQQICPAAIDSILQLARQTALPQVVVGDHHSIMRQPHVAALAQHIRRDFSISINSEIIHHD